MEAVKQFTDIHSIRIINVLRLLLPKLADGFHKQRADVFGFGEFDKDSKMLVLNKNVSKLDKAPINNLTSERHVGSVNYGLGIHGSNELNIVSSSIIKSKSIDLIELKPINEFKKYKNLTKKGGSLNEILAAWNTKQEELKKQGLSNKEISNIGRDTRKNLDLEKLKKFGGPFTNPEDVDLFVNSNEQEVIKETRLYLEVRYARDTCLSLPKSSPLFRLKEKYKNLPISTYQQNLNTYLSKVHCNINISCLDFDNAIELLSDI